MTRQPVTVRVPGSTSNLGSGFDTLGLALRLYNSIRVKPIAGNGVVVVAANNETNGAGGFDMATEAANLFFCRTKCRRFGIEITMTGDVPAGRGLGYSATVRVGILAALNEIAKTRLTREQLLELAVILEGHPDNASPAIFGGFTVSGMIPGGVRCLYFAVSRKVKLVTLVPRFGISTAKARVLLPASYSKADTAHALNRASLIVAAFARDDCDSLRGLFDDRVHQPYRKKLIPQLSRVIQAGEKAGAIGGFLSGSGSSIICVALANAANVAAAMKSQMPKSDVKILSPDDLGFRVLK